MDKKVLVVQSVPKAVFKNVKYKNYTFILNKIDYNYITKCSIQKNENGNIIILETNILKEDIDSIGLECDIELEYSCRDKNYTYSDEIKVYNNMTLRLVQEYCETDGFQVTYLVFSDYRIKDTIIKKELNELINNYYKERKIQSFTDISLNINKSTDKILNHFDRLIRKYIDKENKPLSE